MLDGARFGLLCLLRLRLFILAGLTTSSQGAAHRAHGEAITGVSGNRADDRAAGRAPGSPAEAFTTANRRAGWWRRCAGDGHGIDTCLLPGPGIARSLVLILLGGRLPPGGVGNDAE